MARSVARETFGYLLKQLRDERSVSQETLAAQANYSVSYLSMLERGLRSPSDMVVERIAQALDLDGDVLGHLRSVAQAQRNISRDIKGSLPFPLTPLLGRTRELRCARRLLLEEQARLLTITGPAGVGKTHLSLQLAAYLRADFRDGIYFIDLSAITAPEMVIMTIASMLGIQESGKRHLIDRISERVRQQKMLWVLDNFEQVRDARIDMIKLLVSCPHLVMVVASRVTLEVRGENELNLKPLAVPGSQQHRTEMQALALLQQGDVRLVTLVGQGKVSRIRMALEVASQVREQFAARCTFVDCAALMGSQHLLTTLAQHLGTDEPTSTLTTILEHLPAAPSLFILLNGDAQTEYIQLIAQLLASCPSLVIMTTAISALHIPGERTLLVPKLAKADEMQVDSLDSVLRSPAVALFCQRAQAVRPTFRLTLQNAPAVIEICRRLDGLPLALELAAARLKVLSPMALLDQLVSFNDTTALDILNEGPADLPPRQQSLRHAIAWSYHLLSPAQQRAYRRLSVFVSGGTLSDITTLYEIMGESEGQLSTILDTLVDHSLVQVRDHVDGNIQFSQLQTIREHALSEMTHMGEATNWRQGFANWMTMKIEILAPQLLGANQLDAHQQIARNIDNIREVLRWASTPGGEVQLGLHLGVLLRRYWNVSGQLSEGRAWFYALFSWSKAANSTINPEVFVAAWFVAGYLADLQYDFVLARELLEMSRTTAQSLGDEAGMARAMIRLGVIATLQVQTTQAIALLQESVALCRSVGDEWEEATALQMLAYAYYHHGCLSEAEMYYDASLRLHRQHSDLLAIANTLNDLGQVLVDSGHNDRAFGLFTQSLAFYRQMNAPAKMALSLNNLGTTARLRGNCQESLPLYEEALARYQAMGDERNIAMVQGNLGAAYCDLKCYEKAQEFAALSLGIFVRLQNEWGQAFAQGIIGDIALQLHDVARAEQAYYLHAQYFVHSSERKDQNVFLMGFARIAIARGQFTAAARLYAVITLHQTQHGISLRQSHLQAYETDIQFLQHHLGHETFTTLWQEGTTLSMSMAMSNVLGQISHDGT